MSFDLNILVNGNRCKIYSHQGKNYIQANPGSEYVIEIKNNHWKRILAVGSVDGLNVLTGKTASNNDTGYIVGSYSSEKIKGFRFSDSEWAMFKFGYKFYGNTYAQSKEDGSEKNCGVIGLRIFYEKEPIVTTTIINNPVPYYQPWPSWTYSTLTNTWTNNVGGTGSVNYQSLFGGTGAGNSGGKGLSAGGLSAGGPTAPSYTSNVNYTCNNAGETLLSTNNITSPGISTRVNDECFTDCCQNLIGSDNSSEDSCDFFEAEKELEQPKQEFDMGTEWGRKEYSKVHNVTFDRGCLAHSFDIYYASREALINMGVPITNKLSTNLPQSFPSGYAQPPKNWNG
jgi:hypothetical protein